MVFPEVIFRYKKQFLQVPSNKNLEFKTLFFNLYELNNVFNNVFKPKNKYENPPFCLS